MNIIQKIYLFIFVFSIFIRFGSLAQQQQQQQRRRRQRQKNDCSYFRIDILKVIYFAIVIEFFVENKKHRKSF